MADATHLERCCAAAAAVVPYEPTQVVYPALDSKVKNVTSAYSVEHQDEVRKRRMRLD